MQKSRGKHWLPVPTFPNHADSREAKVQTAERESETEGETESQPTVLWSV